MARQPLTTRSPAREPLQRDRPLPGATLSIGTLSVLATAFPSWNRLLMDLETQTVAWEFWRPLTGHLAHAGTEHLFLNVTAFLLLGSLREQRVGSRRFLVECAVLAVTVAAGVRCLHESWISYRGLSGVVYGLVPLALLGSAGGARRRLGPAIVSLLAVKSLLEWHLGGWLHDRDALEAAMRVTFLPGSHVAGLLGGLALWASSTRATPTSSSPGVRRRSSCLDSRLTTR